MHTSWTIFILFWVGVGLGAISQVCNYRSTFCNNRRMRTWGFWLGLSGTLIAGGAAFTAAINWNTLPLSSQGLRPGQLYDDGGVPAIVESDERTRQIKELSQSAINKLRQSH